MSLENNARVLLTRPYQVDPSLHTLGFFSRRLVGRPEKEGISHSNSSILCVCFSSNRSSFAGDGMNRGGKHILCRLTGLQVPHPHDLKARFDSNETKTLVKRRALR